MNRKQLSKKFNKVVGWVHKQIPSPRQVDHAIVVAVAGALSFIGVLSLLAGVESLNSLVVSGIVVYLLIGKLLSGGKIER